MTVRVLLTFFTLLLFSQSTMAQIKEIIWVSPVWESYTDTDGSGLYNDIVSQVFAAHDVTVKRVYRSWKKSMQMVENGEADMTGGTELSARFHASAFPVINDDVHVLLKKASFDKWHGIQSLDGKTGVWLLGYLDDSQEELRKHIQGFGVTSRNVATDMLLNHKRDVDYYLDNLSQMTISLSRQNQPFDAEAFAFKQIFRTNLHMVFQPTPRGRDIRDMFDEGMNKLVCGNTLPSLYEKYEIEMPDFDTDCQ